MIDELRSLDPLQQKRLISLLEPERDVLALNDDEIGGVLVRVLRDALAVPNDTAARKSDLGEYLRRRMVEVARDDFRIADNLDMTTDTEIAIMLVEYVLDAAAQLSDHLESFEEFETFFRTKGLRQRTQWLLASEEFCAVATEASFDRPAVESAADRLTPGESVRRMLANLRQAREGVVDDAVESFRNATPPTRAAMAATAIGVSGVVVASPLAVTAGAMYMAGLGRRRLEQLEDEEPNRRRARRARRSSQVQAVITVSAFVVAEAPLGQVPGASNAP